MARTRRGETFADTVARTRAEPPVPEPDDPDTPRLPSGERLVRVCHDLPPGEARDLVAGGALLAFEGCGCGGGRGCAPTWYDEHERRRAAALLPRVRGRRAPSWIDLWTAPDDSVVVYAHGEVLWADLMW